MKGFPGAFKKAVPKHWSVSHHDVHGTSDKLYHAVSPNGRWRLRMHSEGGEGIVELEHKEHGDARFEFVDSFTVMSAGGLHDVVEELIAQNIKGESVHGLKGGHDSGMFGDLF